MNVTELTIGRLARAAGVNIETIRYYQRLHLLPTPNPKNGTFRTYSIELVDRIRFIKHAQELGFSLREIASLLQLQDGKNRRAIRKIAGDRLEEIRQKLADLRRMEHVLTHLIHECETAGEMHPCPIVAALTGTSTDHTTKHTHRHRARRSATHAA